MKEVPTLHRILAQRNGVTITATTGADMTFDEVQSDVIPQVLSQVVYQPYVILPITTKERWDEGVINFCPRCGHNLSEEAELGRSASFDCFECNASIYTQIEHVEGDEEE